MSSDTSGLEEVGAVSPSAKLGFGAKIKAHFKRFWWLHLIIFIIVVLVIALPVYVPSRPVRIPTGEHINTSQVSERILTKSVYVGYPNIAQDDVNASTLNITNQVISKPTRDSFHLQQRQVIQSGTSFTPDLYAFNASVALSSASAPFANVLVPKIHVGHKNVIKLDQHVGLSSVEAFTEYTKTVLMSEEVELAIAGKPELQLGALPRIQVDYNETVTMKGVSSLSLPDCMAGIRPGRG